ncbi:MAG TPA: nucleotidyltransferase family protein [Gaiellaceae bacterium]|nr:nucleotidyltransferase family protein [Gaiellaceae bacterium]
MKAIVLAAGYATRLRPLTDSTAKQLLPVGGRPMMDWVCDKLDEVTDDIHVVTNSRFASDFERWAAGRDRVTVHDDGTTSNEDRLGAIGDIAFVLERTGTDDDLLVIAGDNLFDFRLADYVAFWRSKGVASAVAVYDCGDLDLARQYGVVDLGEDERVVGFEEKPAEPNSTLAATAAYLYHRDHVSLVEQYLAEGNPPDQPGRLIEWLWPREPVYAYAFAGEWFDIGNPEQLLEADNRLRERVGLAPRGAYSAVA